MLIDLKKLIQDTKWFTSHFTEEQIPQYLTFTNRETYLQWKSEWKTLYKDLSIGIQFLKENRRTVRPHKEWFNAETAKMYSEKYGYAQNGYFIAADAGEGSMTKRLATALLMIRRQAKVRSIEMKKSLPASAQTA